MATYREYRKALIELVNSIENENGLEEENTILLLHLIPCFIINHKHIFMASLYRWSFGFNKRTQIGLLFSTITKNNIEFVGQA